MCSSNAQDPWEAQAPRIRTTQGITSASFGILGGYESEDLLDCYLPGSPESTCDRNAVPGLSEKDELMDRTNCPGSDASEYLALVKLCGFGASSLFAHMFIANFRCNVFCGLHHFPCDGRCVSGRAASTSGATCLRGVFSTVSLVSR